MPTNAERANRAKVLLEVYATHFGDPDDHSANLTDLLADLMHLSNKRIKPSLSFQKSLSLATLHFHDEVSV